MISGLKFGGVRCLIDKIYCLPQTNRLSKSFSILYKFRTCPPKCGLIINAPTLLRPTYMNLRSSQVSVRNHSTSSNQRSGDDNVAVLHDLEGGKFYIEFPSLGEANIEYERIDNLIILMHTFVPTELEGRGLGKILAKEALSYVAKNNLHLEIQCSFVRHYVSKYEPKYTKYMKDNK